MLGLKPTANSNSENFLYPDSLFFNSFIATGSGSKASTTKPLSRQIFEISPMFAPTSITNEPLGSLSNKL